VDYRPPAEHKVVTSRNLARPAAETWTRLRAAAEKSRALRLESANAKGRTLTLAYRGDAEPYVDCGVLVARVRDGGEITSRDFSAASAHERYPLENDKGRYLVDRQMALAAKIQVQVGDAGKGRANVRVKAFYTLTKSQFVKREGDAGGDAQEETIHFDSTHPGAFLVGGREGTRCRATGQLEQTILNL
jgi:hypothetical protein